MNKETKTEVTAGGSFANLLTIAFIVLKLTHVIDWSWWWVTAPLWIPAGIVVICLILLAILNTIDKD